MNWCGCYRAVCGCCGVPHSEASPLAYHQHPNDMAVHQHVCARCAEHYSWRRVEANPFADRGRDAYGYWVADAKCRRGQVAS